MAQIKKFQVGGKMFIDGHEIDLEEYYKYASSLNGQARTAAMDMYNSAKSGNTVNYDSGRNNATGVQWSDINQAGLDNANKGKGWTRAKARRQAFWGGKGDDFARALQAAGRYVIPEAKEETPKDPELDALFKRDQEFDYNETKGKDGTISKVWSDSLGNADSMAYFNSIKDAVLNWNEDAYKTKYTTEAIDKLRNIRARYDADNDFFTKLETGFKGGNFDNQELWDNLKYIGFKDPNSTTATTENENEIDPNDPWANWRNPFSGSVSDDVLKGRGAQIYTGKDGNLYWDAYKNDDNIYLLNDVNFDYLQNTAYRNGALYKGRLFTQNQILNGTDALTSELRNLINNRRSAGFMTKSFDDWLAHENQDTNLFRYTGRGQRGAFQTFDKSKSYFKNGWDEHFEDGNYEVIDIGAQLDNLPEGTDVVGFIDYRNPQVDFYGDPILKFKVRNKDGQIITMNESEFNRWRKENNITQSAMTRPGNIQLQELSDDGLGFWNDRAVDVDVDGVTKQIWIQRDRNGNLRYHGLGKNPTMIYENSPLWQAIISGQTGFNGRPHFIRGDFQNYNYDSAKASKPSSQVLETLSSRHFKKGGSLPKLQWGGIVSNAFNPNETEEYFQPENIMQTPGHIGSNDMTSADKWQLASLIADGTSVLSSLTNASGAGAIVTGVTGLGGTAAQFISDVKRDGLDWGDAGRATLGIGFDVAGMLPGLGTASKLAKLTKNASKMTKTIGKAIGTAAKAGMAIGTVNAATQAYDKLKSGEKLDVNDWRNILTVISGTVYGTRGLANASRASKAASEVDSHIGRKSDKMITLKSLGTLDGAENIKLSKSDAETISKMMDKKDGAKKIQDFLKSKTGITVEEADLPKILDNYGFDVKSKWFGKKKSVENEALTEGLKTLDNLGEHGTGYYLLHGNKRSNLLDKAANEGILKELANSEGLSHRTRTYLGNRSIWDPESVGMSWDDKIQNNWFADFVPRTHKRVRKNISSPTTSTISANPTLPLPFVIGRQSLLTNIPFKSIYPAPSTILPSLQTTPKSISTSTSKFTPKREVERKIFREIITDLKNIKSSDDLRQFLLKVGFNGHGYNGESVENPYREILNKYPRLKQQLIKHIDNNRWFHGSGIDDFVHKYNLKFKKGGKVIKAQPGTKVPRDVGEIIPTVTANKNKNTGLAEGINTVKDAIDFRKNNPNYGESSNKSYLPFELGEFNGERATDLGMSAGRFATSLGMNKAKHDDTERAIRAGMGALEQMPTETYNRFQDHGITAAYNARANQDRQIKPISSNWLQNAALEQMNKAQADNTELEGRLKLAEMYQQHVQQNADLRRQYNQQKTDIVNRNNARMASMNSALAYNDAEKTFSDFQSIDNFGRELQARNAQNMQEQKAYNTMVAQAQMQNKMNPYSKTTDEQIASMFKPLSPENYNWWYKKPKVQSAKSGSKLRLRADEHIWINQNKATADAIKKINDNIIKLIMKALS